MALSNDLRDVIINRLIELCNIRNSVVYTPDADGKYPNVAADVFYVDPKFFAPYAALAEKQGLSAQQFAEYVQKLLNKELNQRWENCEVLLNEEKQIVGIQDGRTHGQPRVLIVNADGSTCSPFLSSVLKSKLYVTNVSGRHEAPQTLKGIRARTE